MDKSCPSTEDSAPPNPNPNNNNKDYVQYLNQLNKISHKISKPPIRKPPSSSSASFDHLPQSLLIDDAQSHLQPHQPPVYNINKNDFRDVVQKLTGSPAHHDRLSSPPPIQPPKPPSSRLHRIRPPPLENLTNRPPPLPVNPSASFVGGQRTVQPLSPLPPLPAVHAAAESPISAYMRYLQTSSSSAVDSDYKRLSPRWTSFGQPPAPNNSLPSPTVQPLHFPAPSSPLPFGCLPSPKSPPGSLFSAVNQFGFQQFPLSPTPPVPSPRWKSR